MIDRYINNKINAIWNDQNKFDTWKLIQEKYVETLEQLKIAKGGVAKKIQEAEVLKEEVYKQEEITNHDLASFVDILQTKVGEGSNWVHYGLTSSDIVDTANSLLIMQSIEVAQELIHDLLKELKLKAIDEKDTKIIVRTHGVYAEETFLGNIFGNWYLEIKRSLVRVERAKDSIAFGKLSGPVGNHTVVTEEMEELTLEKLGLKDGESIDHPWINKALERAQQKVESRNFDIRKTLLKFDNVLNDQRQVIFNQRKDIINSEDIFSYSNNFLNEISSDFLKYKDSKDFESQIRKLFGKSFSDSEIAHLAKNDDKVFTQNIEKKFLEKRKERIDIIGDNQAAEIEKRILLQSIDVNWKLHIQYLEQLRQVIGLRSYGQRDPLVEYKKEAFMLFENLLNKIKNDLIKILNNLTIVEKRNDYEDIKKTNNIVNNPKCLLILNKGQKISRNDKCEATGKKYKNCCGRL